jgi:RNA polymerase sigma-70 factor (sigma-E family)
MLAVVILFGRHASYCAMLPAVDAPPESIEPPERDDRDVVLAELFRAEYSPLVQLARLLVDERGQAEEVVQEAFARTYEAWPRLRDPEDPLPYVRRAVVNQARGRLRRRLTVRRTGIAPADDAASAESEAETGARRREVVAAVLALPRRQRECVALRYLDDSPVALVAETLGISEGAVKQHLHRALVALARTLEEEGD